ncbi:unnamed protein product [Linum tenue]|uniref:Nodulin-like domain-containing protein n=1 Tax=Linum tenue TaxID=586396 RepID=A0AAV0LTQ3_9ROSI|nr:unnamed protein product [Linum tenue]
MKEHALITIFASCGSSGVYAVNIVTIIKAFYKRGLNPGAAFLLVQTTQQVGSGLNGLGVASFGLDWATVASFLGSPIANPLYAIVNSFVGFLLLIYVVLPIAYWGNVHHAKRFPIFSSDTFDSTGQPYNITRIINDKSFDINLSAYDGYSKIHLSIFFAFVYGLSFATLTATISHVALFDGQ